GTASLKRWGGCQVVADRHALDQKHDSSGRKSGASDLFRVDLPTHGNRSCPSLSLSVHWTKFSLTRYSHDHSKHSRGKDSPVPAGGRSGRGRRDHHRQGGQAHGTTSSYFDAHPQEASRAAERKNQST